MGLEDLLRQLAPQVLGALLRRYGNWEMCEDALQEALLEVSDDWDRNGVPERPSGLTRHRGEPEDDRSDPQRICSSGSRGAHPGARTSGRVRCDCPARMRTSTGTTR